MTNRDKKTKNKEINMQIDAKLVKRDQLLWLQDKITPFQDKLDKNSTFYKHYMQKMDTQKLMEKITQQAQEDSSVLQSIAVRLGPKKDSADAPKPSDLEIKEDLQLVNQKFMDDKLRARS